MCLCLVPSHSASFLGLTTLRVTGSLLEEERFIRLSETQLKQVPSACEIDVSLARRAAGSSYALFCGCWSGFGTQRSRQMVQVARRANAAHLPLLVWVILFHPHHKRQVAMVLWL